LVLALVLGVVFIAACGAEPTPTESPAKVKPPETTVTPAATTFDSPLDMANPASVFCVEQGYRLEMREEAAGTAGYCIFPDGSECEEWAFYRGECAPGGEQAGTGVANPASVFCVEEGYRLEMREEAAGTAGYCIFPDGSECEEWAFFRGECKPGTTP
jgi:putative hemolysin